jgi:hypothetical protein
MTRRLRSQSQRSTLVSFACGLSFLALALIALWRLQRALPGTPLDRPAERFEVPAGESVWQQFAVPVCQPNGLTIAMAEPVAARGVLSATFFVRDDLDKWSDAPVTTARTTLASGQAEVHIPFPDAINARRRLIRLKLTPESTSVAFRTAPDNDHSQQYVTRRPGYLGLESLIFRADYPGSRWLVPLRCVADMQFPNLPPIVLCGAILTICAITGWLCGLVWRMVPGNQ